MLAAALLHLICLKQQADLTQERHGQAALGSCMAEKAEPPRQALCAFTEEMQVQIEVASSRCVTVAETPDSRVEPPPQLAPGQPPILTFRYYEGQLHHRFGNSDLMLDDAGH